MDHPLGLHSKKQEWKQLQEMPTYKEALINEVERSTCASMCVCPYAKGRMAAATSSFDLGSLVPKIPGARLISQLTNPWNLVSLSSLNDNLFLQPLPLLSIAQLEQRPNRWWDQCRHQSPELSCPQGGTP